MKHRTPYYPKTQSLSSIFNQVAKPILKNGGYYYATLVLDWVKIIGVELAENTMPIRLSFPRGQGVGATLMLQVNPGSALIVGFQKGLIIEKIAAFYGKRLVSDIHFKQAPIIRSTIQIKKNTVLNKSNQLSPSILNHIQSIEDECLRQALIRLGECIKN